MKAEDLIGIYHIVKCVSDSTFAESEFEDEFFKPSEKSSFTFDDYEFEISSNHRGVKIIYRHKVAKEYHEILATSIKDAKSELIDAIHGIMFSLCIERVKCVLACVEEYKSVDGILHLISEYKTLRRFDSKCQFEGIDHIARRVELVDAKNLYEFDELCEKLVYNLNMALYAKL